MAARNVLQGAARPPRSRVDQSAVEYEPGEGTVTLGAQPAETPAPEPPPEAPPSEP